MRRSGIMVWMMATVGLVGVSCRALRPNHDPIVVSLDGPQSVTANQVAIFSASATDPDGDEVGYGWNCTRGQLSSDSGDIVHWTAPNRSGHDTVAVNVDDRRGGFASKSRAVEVAPVTTTLVRWDGYIRARQAGQFWAHVDADYRVEGTFSVDSLDINFLMLDAGNYEKWNAGQPYTAIREIIHSAGSAFSDTIGQSGTYWFILDNEFSQSTDKFGHLVVRATSP